MGDSDVLACLWSKLVGILLLELGAETNLDRIVVGGTERVAVAVNRVIAVAEEVLGVVLATRVLERNRLVAVDVPDSGILHKIHGHIVRKNVIKRTELAVKLVGSLVVVLLGVDDVETSVLKRGDCIFHCVCVEVADQEGRKVGPLVLLAEVLEKGVGLRGADIRVSALTVTLVLILLVIIGQ